MQKVIPKIFILIIFFFSLISTQAQEEKEYEFMVKGRAYDNQNNKLAGVKVIIKQNGKVIKTFTSSTSGVLPGEPVPFGHMYTFIYEKPGYTKVTMTIDAKNGYFPDDFMYSKPMDKNNPTVMAVPEPRITLYKKVPNIDYSVLENKPRAKLGFQQGEFDFDKHYINSRKNEVDGFLDKIEEQLEKIEQDYQNLVSAGDKAYAAGDYAAAMAQYKKALAVKPDNKALKDKIAKTTEKIRLAEELKKKQAEFDKIIADGDNLLSQDKLDEAVAKYKAAQSIMPTSGVPNKKIALVNKRREELAAIARKKQFDAIVASADKLFQQKNIEEAKLKYQEASALISDEPYPKQQLVEIERIIKERKQKELNYAKLLSEGDQFLSSKEFEKSLSKYQEALALLPEKSPEVNDRIKKLEEAKRKAEELRKREQQYKDLMASAEKSLAAKQYDGAIGLFQQASGLFSDRPLPKERINYASQLKEKAEAEKRKKEQFNLLIDNADAAFSSKSYEEAKSTYDEALKLYPDDAYAKKRYAEAIQKIREIEEEKKRLAEIEKKYNGFIAQGNEFKNTEKYPEAIKAYNAALGIKNGDPVAIQKIEEVKKIIKQKEEEKLKREKYESLLTEAGRLFTTKDYETAIDKYTEASNLFQNEAYPKEQIILAQAKLKEKQEEERRLAEEQKKKDDFDKLIAQADDRFNSENYEEAISVYQQAKTLFPSNPYPAQKINSAEQLLRKKAEEEAKQKSQAERDAEFKRLIEEGDQLFTQEQYDKAKLAYNNALALNDTPELRKKIADSDRMIAEQNAKKQQELDNKSIDDQYNKIVSSADTALETGDYKSAKKLYQKALTFKNEEYPKSKIAQIDEQFKKDLENQNQAFAEAKKKEEFNTLILKGDNAVNSNNYSAGIAYYEQAKKLEVDNSVVDAKINKAKQLKQEFNSTTNQAEESSNVEENYANAIQLADKAFNQEDYQRAISKYREALGYKANEQHPLDRIRLAEQKLDEISSLNNSNLIEEEYTRFVTKASDEENSGKLKEAKQYYERALNVKKGDAYAQKQIARLDQKILDVENEKYQGLIESGDDKFEKEKYVPAKEDYTEALDIKPGDIYPKDKISEIDEILEEKETKSTYVASDESYYDLDGYQEVIMTEDEIIGMMEQSVNDNDYTRPQISEQTEDENSNTGFERILSNRDKSLQLEEEYKGLKSDSKTKEISLDKQRVAATNELETVIDKTVKTGNDWQGNQQRITQNQDEYVQQIESNRQTDELEGGLRRERVLDEYGNYIDATNREAVEIQSVTDIRRSQIEAEMNINQQDRDQAELENDFRRETFVSEIEATGDENSAKFYSLTDEATKKSIAAEESYDLLETERVNRLLEADKPREFKTQQLEIYTQNQRLDENNRIEKSKSALLANQDAADDVTTRIAQEAIDNDAPRKEVMKEYESYEDQRVYIFNEYEKESNEKSLSNEMAYNEIESQRAEEFLSADQPRLNANVELALYEEEALQTESDRKAKTDLRNDETYKDYGNLTSESEEKSIKSDIRRNRAIIDTENSSQSNIESNKSDASFADSKRQAIADQIEGNVSEEQEKSLIGKANQEKNSTSINQYSEQNTNTNNSIRNNAQNKNLETAEEMDEDDRQSPTYMSDQMTDDLALKYPEGVTEKKYASKNAQGQVTGYVMIRIVVKGNKGWEYKKEVTNQITRFYKNGVPITSDVWDRETSGPAAD